MKKFVYFFVGLIGCFSPFLIDLVSADSRHPTFSYWFAGLFRPIAPVTKAILMEFVSNYFFVASCICVVIYAIFATRWFLLKTNNSKDYTVFKSAKYPLNWLFSLIAIFVMQTVYWFFAVSKSLAFNGIGYAYLLLFLLIINLSSFILLPLSFFFPSNYSNIPFFSSKN